MLSTIDGAPYGVTEVDCFCGLPQTTVGEGMWLVKVNEEVMEGDAFGSLPQAAWFRGGRDSEGIYVLLCSEVRISRHSEVAQDSRICGEMVSSNT